MRGEIIVVGAGFAGSVMARCLAEAGKKVRLVERRNHIAGNMYDHLDENGVRIQEYGPHVFHTNLESVHDFVTKYCELEPYDLKCTVMIDGKLTPSPFNFQTIDQFYALEEAEDLKQKLRACFHKEYATILEMLACQDEQIRSYARFLFEKDYSLYTAKQWGKKPEEIDPSVLGRVPVVFSYMDSFFRDKYEGIPKGGFTALFDNLLRHPDITVQLGVDALEHICLDRVKNRVIYDGTPATVVYTGAVDELFGYQYGRLPYRSLYFAYERHEKKDYQPSPVVVHPPLNIPYTRTTEYTKLPYQDVGDYTVIAKEYPINYDRNDPKASEPYYPVLTEQSKKNYQAYKEYAERFDDLILCGRLAEFQYYNMDSVIDHTLRLFERTVHSL